MNQQIVTLAKLPAFMPENAAAIQRFIEQRNMAVHPKRPQVISLKPGDGEGFMIEEGGEIKHAKSLTGVVLRYERELSAWERGFSDRGKNNRMVCYSTDWIKGNINQDVAKLPERFRGYAPSGSCVTCPLNDVRLFKNAMGVAPPCTPHLRLTILALEKVEPVVIQMAAKNMTKVMAFWAELETVEHIRRMMIRLSVVKDGDSNMFAIEKVADVPQSDFDQYGSHLRQIAPPKADQ